MNGREAILYSLIVAAWVWSLQPSHSVLINNGSFESGFTGWNTTGNANTTGTFGTANPVAPTVGTSQAFLRNDNTGGTRVSRAALETFLGVTNNSLNTFENSLSASGGNVFSGSAIQTSFTTTTAGDALFFDWQFVSQEDGNFGSDFNDLAFYHLSGPGGTSTFGLLSDINSSTQALANLVIGAGPDPPAGDFNLDNATAYTQTGLALGAAGSYTISFGVVNVGDDFTEYPSGLFVDFVHVVPEPSTWLMGALILGVILWHLFVQYRKRQQALQPQPIRVRFDETLRPRK